MNQIIYTRIEGELSPEIGIRTNILFLLAYNYKCLMHTQAQVVWSKAFMHIYILHTKSHTHIYICFTQCVDDAKRRACKAPNILMYTCTIRTCSIYGLCVRARHEALPRDDVILISKLKVKKAKALGMNIIATDSRKNCLTTESIINSNDIF